MDRLVWWRIAKNFQFVKKKKKNAVSVKHSKAKFSKMSYTCTDELQPVQLNIYTERDEVFVTHESFKFQHEDLHSYKL